MNPDPLFSHCSIPQGPFPNNSQFKEHGLKVVYSGLPVGSLVLVKACNWPWYGMVGSRYLCARFQDSDQGLKGLFSPEVDLI
jgi:hypothetical protein